MVQGGGCSASMRGDGSVSLGDIERDQSSLSVASSLSPCTLAHARGEGSALSSASSTSGPRSDTALVEVPEFRLEPPVAAASIVPLSEGYALIRITAHQGLLDKIEQARHLMRHQVPSGDVIVVLERALDMLISERKKKLFGQTDKPRRTPPPQRRGDRESRYVPRAVRREVSQRDGEQCTFVSAEGLRCTERGRLELDHYPVPFTRGGPSTPENLRLRCAARNLLAAEQTFGRELVLERIDAARAVRGRKGGSTRSRPRILQSGGAEPTTALMAADRGPGAAEHAHADGPSGSESGALGLPCRTSSQPGSSRVSSPSARRKGVA